MAEQHADPVTRPGLRVVTASTGSDPDPVTKAVAVVPMSRRERTGNVARRHAGAAAEVARELWLYPGRLLHSLAHGKAESMREHWAHIRSRAWVPEGMTGSPEKAVVAAGVFYHLPIPYPGKAGMGSAKFAPAKGGVRSDRPPRVACPP